MSYCHFHHFPQVAHPEDNRNHHRPYHLDPYQSHRKTHVSFTAKVQIGLVLLNVSNYNR